MSSHSISVDLEADNVLWLESQAITTGRRNLSETLNAILTRLRTGAEKVTETETTFEVTARIADSDPDLKEADAAIRKLYAQSIDRSAKILARSSREPR